MSCVNDRYSPAELESIFLWDCLCEALPLTAEERREINERDTLAKTKRTALPRTDERAAKEEERKLRKREYNRRYREANRERIRELNAAYQKRNRESINERQREYDRAKSASKKAARMAAQP